MGEKVKVNSKGYVTVPMMVEEIFSQAVALDQSGGLRNTIYVIGNEIYILNYDHTVLLRFQLRSGEGGFKHPISFKANDYDSNLFKEEDGKIVFYTESGGYEKKKICGTTDLTPLEVKELYHRYMMEIGDRKGVDLSKDILELTEAELSHIEFSGTKEDGINIIQRNIYSGGITEIKKTETPFAKEILDYDFGPVAIKTGDFKALFYFEDILKFYFPRRDKEDFILVKGLDENKRSVTAIIACCLYDEIIEIKEALQNKEEVTYKRNK